MQYHPNDRKKRSLGRELPPGRDQPTEGLVNAFLQTLGRVYFSRTWIIQEVAVATSSLISCGDIELGWADFFIAVKYFLRFEEGLFKQISGDRRVDQVLLIDRDRKELSSPKQLISSPHVTPQEICSH